MTLTLKHKLVLLLEPHSSWHLGSGVVVGSGGPVTPSAQCLHTNFAFSSHFNTSHKPPASPVLMATHPAFRPALNRWSRIQSTGVFCGPAAPQQPVPSWGWRCLLKPSQGNTRQETTTAAFDHCLCYLNHLWPFIYVISISNWIMILIVEIFRIFWISNISHTGM